MSSKIDHTEGMLCAPFTPFTETLDLNLQPIPAYASMLKSNRICGVFVNGSSGEGLLLTQQERMKTLEAWVDESDANFKVIAHVGATSVRESQMLAKHAAETGAFGISVMGSPFPPINRVEELVAYCADIAREADDLPFYYYHIPGLSGVNLPMLEYLRLAEQSIPTLAGIKYTSPDLHDFTRCARFKERKFDLLYGQDESILAAMALSDAKGFIGGTFNYCAKVYREITQAFRNGDLVRAGALQRSAMDIIDVIVKYRGNMVAGKQTMKHVGFDLGPCRQPFQNMCAAEFEMMKSDLGRTLFFDYRNSR